MYLKQYLTFLSLVTHHYEAAPITSSRQNYTYIDDIADIETIRKASQHSDNRFLRRDEEVSASGSAAPTTVVMKDQQQNQIFIGKYQLDFMKKYGYLSPGDSNSAALHTEESISRAIKQMQLFGGIFPSGKLDEDTLKVKNFKN